MHSHARSPNPAGRDRGGVRRRTDRAADSGLSEGGGRGPHLGRGAGGAPPRDGQADGRRRGAGSRGRSTLARRSAPTPAGGAWIARIDCAAKEHTTNGPSGRRATAAGWCSPASTPLRWCLSKSPRCAARNWRSSTCAGPTTNRTRLVESADRAHLVVRAAADAPRPPGTDRGRVLASWRTTPMAWANWL